MMPTGREYLKETGYSYEKYTEIHSLRVATSRISETGYPRI